MGGRAAVPVAVAFWLGLVLGVHADARMLVAALGLAAAFAWLADRAPPRTGTLLVTLLALLAGFARGGAHAQRLAAARAALPPDDAFVRVVAIVAEPVQRERDVPAALVRVRAASPALPRGTRLRLQLPADCAADWGDTLVAYARLTRFSAARNPGGFDARAAADAHDVLAHGRAFTAAVAPARELTAAPRRAALRLRRGMEAALASALTPAARELAAPLLFGDRSALTPELDAALRGSGLVHLLALSGLHVLALAALARGLVAWARGGVRSRALAGACAAAAYVLLAGPLPAVVRAAVGEGALALARLTQRALDPLQALALGTLALLAVAPGWAGDLGLQLACAAVLGLVALVPPAGSALARRPVLAALAWPLAATLAAQLTTLPLLVARYHAVPWLGFVTNVPAVPVAALLLAGVWLGALAECALPGAGTVWLHACEPLAAALRVLAASGNAVPLALWPCGRGRLVVAFTALGALLLVLALPAPRTAWARRGAMSPRRRRALALAAACLVAALLAALVTRPLAPPRGAWWLVAIDVGQGDALALAWRGQWWLVDTGPRSATWDAGEGAVLPFLRWAGVRRLERLIVTHDDSDHSGGAPAVQRGLLVARTFTACPRPGVADPAARLHADTLARGMVLDTAPHVRVLWPPHAGERDAAIAARGTNAAGVVLEIGDGSGRALLTADVDTLVEPELALAPGLAVLKAGHHGAAASSGAALVLRLAPRRVLLSVGEHNVYGHPSPAAVARLALTGATFDRTDRDGAIWYEFTTRGVRRIEWRWTRMRQEADGPP